ncbi:MAG: hydroxymethylbilane synthase, partial [Actinomycetota bacterium]|nr:hydroxymethylbilane synthase [Actinomycetota bacterium]
MTDSPRRAPAVLRLGTRRSALALAQSRLVAESLQRSAAAGGHPLRVELVEITTPADLSPAPLTSFGGVGVFASALREALQAGQVDLAVHSLKDLPTAPADGLVLAAVPERADPRDALVARDGLDLAGLGPGARIGTGSPRRAAQLRALGTGLQPVEIRGNVDGRIERVRAGTLDGVLLARAGLLRLGRAEEITEVIPVDTMLPAPGQGALAVECLRGNTPVRSLLEPLDHRACRLAVHAERSLLAVLDAGCSAPVGALAALVEGPRGSVLSLRAVVASP